MPVDFAAKRKEAEKAGLLGSGDYLKLKEGANRLRLLSECLAHPGEYQGKKTFKWLCYVIDRVDGKLKPFFMPHTIYKMIEGLQQTEDYVFYEVPMPYDVTIVAKGAGTIDVEYSVLPARKNTPLTEVEEREFLLMKPLSELQSAFREKKGEKTPPPSDEDQRGHVDDHGDPVPF